MIQNNKIKEIEYKNISQDNFINGLLNENSDGRLTIKSSDSLITLENSKKGMAIVNKIIGETTLINEKLKSTF